MTEIETGPVEWIDGFFYPVGVSGDPDLSRRLVWRNDLNGYVPVPAGWVSSTPA